MEDENEAAASKVPIAEEERQREATVEGEEQKQEVEPTREEILAMSRDENKNGDEREKQYYQKANSMAFGTALLVSVAILLVSVIRDGRIPCEIMLLYTASQAVNNLIISRGAVKTKKLYLVLGIAFAVLAVLFLVMWILQMCGVIGNNI